MTGRKKSSEAYEISSINVIDSFLGSVEESEEFQTVLISSINPYQHQPRRYFDEDKLDKLAVSIREAGILQPLLVRRLNDGSYQLIAGERRYRAAIIAGLKEVPVIIRDLNDEQVQEFALIENLAREDLNPIEETEGILELVATKLGCTKNEVIKLLQVGGHSERDSAKEVILSSQWKVVDEIFTKVGRFTPESFRVNRLPLLNLPEDILQAIREGDLEYSKARLIARVQDTRQRQNLLEAAINERLSRSQINQRIKELKTKNHQKKQESGELIQQMETIYKQVKKTDFSVNPERQSRIKILLDELQQLLKE